MGRILMFSRMLVVGQCMGYEFQIPAAIPASHQDTVGNDVAAFGASNTWPLGKIEKLEV